MVRVRVMVMVMVIVTVRRFGMGVWGSNPVPVMNSVWGGMGHAYQMGVWGSNPVPVMVSVMARPPGAGPGPHLCLHMR